jgi:hypothetical protein
MVAPSWSRTINREAACTTPLSSPGTGFLGSVLGADVAAIMTAVLPLDDPRNASSEARRTFTK